MGNGYYDRSGAPISMEQWAAEFRGDNAVAKTEIDGLAVGRLTLRKTRTVSTVWLGLDHNFWGGPPLIFETMVFPDQEQWRYSTETEARAHHAEVVRLYSRWWWLLPLRERWSRMYERAKEFLNA